MEIKKIIFCILFCVYITSCSTKHYIKLTDIEYKYINIPRNYTAIYCNCDNNPLLLTIISKLKQLGIKVITIDNYTKFDEIKSNNNIVIYGYSKIISGSQKNYTKTNLVSKSEKTNCGKGCTVKRSWNELVEKTVTNSDNSIHNNVLIYKIDENTELLMSVNSGDKYTIRTSTKPKNAYIFN